VNHDAQLNSKTILTNPNFFSPPSQTTKESSSIPKSKSNLREREKKKK